MLAVVFHFYHQPGEMDSWGSGAVDEVRLERQGYEVLVNKQVIVTWPKDKVEFMHIGPAFACRNCVHHCIGIAA
jgi:hypothetical protein